jgi:type II secretory ATPase GspE/PulE/Tfp pilus assembly ATPase PilB-like protein
MERSAQSTDEWIVPVLRELLTPAQLGSVTRDASTSRWQAAVASGFTTDADILRAISARTRMRVAGALTSSPQAVARVPERLARRYSILPLSISAKTIEVATANPYDLDCEQAVAFASGRRVRMSLAVPARITERLEEVYRPSSVVERLLASVGPVSVHQIEPEADARTATQLADSARERPIIKLVDHIVAEGIAARASDIHLEAEEDAVLVRYRVDGVLRTALTLPRAVGTPLVSRVKIMARMDIADRLRPQGGRALVMVDGERIDLRVSTLPASHGEKVVIRILDARGGVRSLDALGFDENDAARLLRLLETREGLILVTGPTGSGKTTTLYSALHSLLQRGLNVITVEDPVEYRIPGIVQSQVNEKAGLTFAAALRSILRQDPDVILVGEMRDPETASIWFSRRCTRSTRRARSRGSGTSASSRPRSARR